MLKELNNKNSTLYRKLATDILISQKTKKLNKHALKNHIEVKNYAEHYIEFYSTYSLMVHIITVKQARQLHH